MSYRMIYDQSVSSIKFKSNFIFGLFFIWVVVSSVYYFQQLLSGNITASYEDSILSKAAKYLIALFFSVYFLIRSGSFIVPSIILMLLGFLLPWYLFLPEYIYLYDSYIVILTMIGLCSVLGTATRSMIVRLGKIIIATGVLVSVIAVLEVSFLTDVYADYWAATGGVRAISTLLNPNNLGVYLGACLILCFAIPGAILGKALSIVIIMIGMYLSGSRTAWLSFAVVFSLWFLKFGMERVTKTSRIVFVILAILAGIVLALIVSSQASDVARLQDFTSANIRLEKYQMYLNGFNLDYFFPDFDGARLFLVSESSYFLLINAFGIVGILFIIALVSLSYGFRASRVPFFPYLVLYYIVVGVFENMVNSFPNNQLFLLSLGSILTLRPFVKQISDLELKTVR
ncbi:MAG: hypothetical protein Q7J46_06880 [Pseudomonas sp.]|nr:hypothetical protein [Pseudomonas sp.]